MSKEVLAKEEMRIYSLKEVRLPLLLGIGWSSCDLFDSESPTGDYGSLARTRVICNEDIFSRERKVGGEEVTVNKTKQHSARWRKVSIDDGNLMGSQK